MSSNRGEDTKPRLDLDPRLPLELEQEIFLSAIQIEIKNAAKLLLVSKRIREWILPILFKVVVIRQNHFTPFPFTQPSLYASYGSQIQHLLISNVNAFHAKEKFATLFPALDKCLLRCPNLTNLAFWCNNVPVVLKTLTKLPKLTYLSIDASHLRTLIQGFESRLKNRYRRKMPILFPKLTHLNILRSLTMNQRDSEQYLTTLIYHFPALTHFAHSQFLWQESSQVLLDFTSEKFKSLEVFVVWKSGIEKDLAVDDEPKLTSNDERVVFVRTLWEKDWESEARGTGLGIWMLAEEVLDERKKPKL